LLASLIFQAFEDENTSFLAKRIDDALLAKLKKVAKQILKKDYDAEEAVMHAILLLSENAEKLKGLDENAFLAMCITYTKNEAKRLYRAHKRESELLVEYVDEVHGTPDDETGGKDPLLCEENLALLTSLLQKLPEPMRDVLHLRYFMNMRYAEIGELMGIAEATARKRAQRGKLMLKKWMEEVGYRGQEK